MIYRAIIKKMPANVINKLVIFIFDHP